MNRIRVVVEETEEAGGVTRVVARAGSRRLTADTLELWQKIERGKEIFFVFKETEVSIAKEMKGRITLSNIFEGRVLSIEKGGILSRVVVDTDGEQITSIVTSDALERLELKTGDSVKALVKATEVSLEEAD